MTTDQQLKRIQELQAEYLHDASTSLQLDPHDEGFLIDDFTLLFDSQRNAMSVARLACKNYRDTLDDDFINSQTQPARTCFPSVITKGNKHHALICFEA